MFGSAPNLILSLRISMFSLNFVVLNLCSPDVRFANTSGKCLLKHRYNPWCFGMVYGLQLAKLNRNPPIS
jgi:hypothetical protein